MSETNQIIERSPGAGLYTRLGGKLGVSRIHSDRDLAALVERRLPASAIKMLVQSGLSDAEVYRLILPRRTLAHRAGGDTREPRSSPTSTSLTPM